MYKLNVVFMGTPEFAVPALEALISEHNVVGVITQPDKPKGRGHKMQMNPVKTLALNNSIPVYQPIKIKNDDNIINKLKAINPDVIVVVAFGQILPKVILDIPKYGCINIHASLLPDLRGAAPINWSIIRGYNNTGITTMKMNEGLDTGDILLKEKISIEESDTYESLHDKLMSIGSELIIDTLKELVNGSLKPIKQNDELSSYAPIMTKELGHINWNETSENIYNLIRGVTPWPGAYTVYNDKIIKIWKAEKLDLHKKCNPSQIVEVNKNGIIVACSDGFISLTEIQEFGGKRMNTASYLNGHDIETNINLK